MNEQPSTNNHAVKMAFHFAGCYLALPSLAAYAISPKTTAAPTAATPAGA
jgi:hypothetical protein